MKGLMGEMVTQTLIDFLKDEKTDINLKYKYIDNLKLSYSDLFELIELFKYENKICGLLQRFTYYNDDKLNNKVRLQKSEYKRSVRYKNSRKRRISNDKHKRR